MNEQIYNDDDTLLNKKIIWNKKQNICYVD